MWSLVVLASVFGFGSSLIPPETWQENWFEHNQSLTRHYYDDDIAVYFDNDMNKSWTWMNSFVHDLWVYVKRTYGDFGEDPHLYLIFHHRKYGGCHISTYFDASKLYRNVVDLGSLSANAWAGKEGDLDYTHGCVSLIIHSANHGVHGSPYFSICGHQFGDMLMYDAYKGMNRQLDAQRIYDKKIGSTSKTPREGTYWFRDWFYPIYEQYGGAKVLNSFLELVAKYMPKSNTESFNRAKYTRDMNFGEFVHFWSGAAKVNLKGLAKDAFGWSDQYESEFRQARKDFPDVIYYNIIL